MSPYVILDAASGPVVLIVHSRNGMVVAQAAEARPETLKAVVSRGCSRARGIGGW